MRITEGLVQGMPQGMLQDQPPRLRITPDTVTLAQPFTVDVSLRVPAGARVLWPTPSDSLASIALRARPEQVGDGGDGIVTVRYRAAAWDTGMVTVSWPPALIVQGGDTTRIALPPIRVAVRSVLPADTAQHQPKPFKGVITDPVLWWPWVLGGVILLLGVWWWRRVRAARRFRRRHVPASPYTAFREALDAASRGLLASPAESVRAVAVSERAFRHLLHVVHDVSPSLSATECVGAVRAVATQGRMAPEISERIARLLAHLDTVLYSTHAVTRDERQQLLGTMRAIADAMESHTPRDHAPR